MLGAGKRLPSALIAAYAAIFLLTPLAGTSLLADPNEPKSAMKRPRGARQPNEEAGRAFRARAAPRAERRVVVVSGVRVVADRIGGAAEVRRREPRGPRFYSPGARRDVRVPKQLARVPFRPR